MHEWWKQMGTWPGLRIGDERGWGPGGAGCALSIVSPRKAWGSSEGPRASSDIRLHGWAVCHKAAVKGSGPSQVRTISAGLH